MHDDHRDQRKPPSVVLAALALDAVPTAPTLTDEVIAVAKAVRDAIVQADRTGTILEVRNPAHPDDIFTDRWPEDQRAQRLWAADLEHLITRLNSLRLKGFDPVSATDVFGDLFGKDEADFVIEEHFRAQNRSILDGTSRMTAGGKPSSPAMPNLPAKAPLSRPAIVGAGGAGLITPARANTGMGGDIPDDDR